MWPADEGVGSSGAPGYEKWPVPRRTPRGAKLLPWKRHWRSKSVLHPVGGARAGGVPDGGFGQGDRGACGGVAVRWNKNLPHHLGLLFFAFFMRD